MAIDESLINQFSDNSSGSLEGFAQEKEAVQQKSTMDSLMGSFQDTEEEQVAPEKEDFISVAAREYSKAHPTESMVLEAGKGLVSGVASAVEQTANFALDAADAFENVLSGMGYGSGDMLDEGTQINVVDKLFGEPKSPAEYGAKLVGQYLAPFGAVNKLVKAKGIIGISKNVGLSATLSAMITDPEDQRLANLVQANPALANPIAEFLATNEDDPRILSRVKTGIEAALVDVTTLGMFKAGEAVFKGVRAGKELRKVRQLEKISKADPVPTGSVIDETAIQKNEVRINAEFEAQAAKASKATPGTEGAPAPQVTGKEAKQAVDPKLPKEPPLTPEEVKQLTKAQEFSSSAKNMPELVAELKASGRSFTANDLHEIARRGTVKDATNVKLAEKIMAQEGKVDELFNRKFGEALNQEERTALKMDYMAKQLEVDNFIAGVKNIDDMTEAELAVFQERLVNLQALDASIEAASSESGRALRSSQKYPGVLEGTDDAFKMKKMREYLKLNGGTESAKETLKQLKQLQDAGINTFDFMRHKAASLGTKVSDAAFEMWINNVLSGPSTLLLTNPVSNLVGQGMMIGEAATGSLIGRIVGKGQVEGEVAAQFAGLVDAFSESFGAAKTVFKSDTVLPKSASKFVFSRTKALSSEAFNMDPNSMIGRLTDVVGHLWNTPTRILTAQDVFFNMMNGKARTYQLAHRQALQQGFESGSKEYAVIVESLKKNPTAGMMKEAARFAQELTLTTPLGATQGVGFGPAKITGESIQKLQQFMEKVPLGRYMGAFMRVSTNLADRTIQRTPISFLRPDTRRALLSGNAARAQEEIAKITLGTGILATGGLMAHQGMITGSGPDDPKMKKALRSSGWQPDSLKLPGGGYVQLKQLGVGGILLKMSADLAELTGRIDADDEDSYLTDELILAGATTLMSSMTPEYLTRGVPDFFTVIKDLAEGRSGPEDLATSAARFSTGFVPMSGFTRQMGNLIDPEKRDTISREGHSIVGKTWERVKNEWLETAGLAGYAGMPPELNIFGEEVYSPIGVGDSIKSAIFGNNRDPNDPVVKELIRLDSTGSIIHIESPNEEALSIRMPERTKRKGIGIGQGVTVPVKLNPQQYHDYVKLAAGLKVGDLHIGAPPLKEALKEVINSPSYKDKTTTKDMQKIMIKKTVSKYKSAAWQVMMMRPDINEEINSRGQERVKSLFGRELGQ